MAVVDTLPIPHCLDSFEALRMTKTKNRPVVPRFPLVGRLLAMRRLHIFPRTRVTGPDLRLIRKSIRGSRNIHGISVLEGEK